jgi:hypothetical protein
MKRRYLDLHTGEVITAKQLLAFENGKDRIWETTNELYSLLADIANAKEEEAHLLLYEVENIRTILEQYQSAEDSLAN